MQGASGQRGDGETAWRAYLRLGPEPQTGPPDSATRTDEEGWIQLIAWTLAIDAPRDATSGLPTGKRRHRPLVVAKPVDQHSSRLLAALVDEEILQECVLEIWGPSKTADRGRVSADDLLDRPYEEAFEVFRNRLAEERKGERRECTIRLEEARIVEIEAEMSEAGWQEAVLQPPHERISLTSERVTMTWHREDRDASVTFHPPEGSDQEPAGSS